MKTSAEHVTRLPSGLARTALLLLLAGLFVWKAQLNYRIHDPVNSNFFSFWLSGHMVWTGESPYDAAQFKAGFDAYGATYRPSRILQYPLPLMYFMAPIGALPVREAYFAWQLVSECVLAFVVFVLLRRQVRARSLLVALSAGLLLFFGPVYLSLQIGSVGAIALLAVGLAIFLLEIGWSVPAGLALSMTLLKPPQAMALLPLVGVWFIARRQGRVIAGMAAGAMLLLATWLVRDPLGLVKFRDSSDFLLGHSMGVQSNVYGFAYLACGQNVPCMWVLGSVLVCAVLALGAYVLWRNRGRWDDWEALNVIIPLAFLCAVYLWSYDQILYVIPVVWIAARLLIQKRSYVRALGFLLLADLVSLVALAVQAYTQQDLLSGLTTLLVLGTTAWLLRDQREARAEGARA